MKKMRNLMNETEVQKSQVNEHRPINQSVNGFKKLLFTAAILMATFMVNAQSIEQQAEKSWQ